MFLCTIHAYHVIISISNIFRKIVLISLFPETFLIRCGYSYKFIHYNELFTCHYFIIYYSQIFFRKTYIFIFI